MEQDLAYYDRLPPDSLDKLTTTCFAAVVRSSSEVESTGPEMSSRSWPRKVAGPLLRKARANTKTAVKAREAKEARKTRKRRPTTAVISPNQTTETDPKARTNPEVFGCLRVPFEGSISCRR